MTELYLEDFTVGQTFDSGRLKVTATEITRFARDFDPERFHLDYDAAKTTFFWRSGRKRVAHSRADEAPTR